MLYIDTIETHIHDDKTGNNFQRQMDWNNHLLPNIRNLIAKKEYN